MRPAADLPPVPAVDRAAIQRSITENSLRSRLQFQSLIAQLRMPHQGLIFPLVSAPSCCMRAGPAGVPVSRSMTV
jgi:hypothetical protein